MMAANPPFFATLVAGLLIAFALQLLLTNVGIAAGITALGHLPNTDSNDAEIQEATSIGNTVRTIGFALGFGTLLTVNTVLFVACLLAVKLSMTSSAVVGAILGVVIWSAYFLILVWLGSIAAGSLISSVLGVIDVGWQGLRAIAKTVSGNQAVAINTSSHEQIATEMALLGEAQRQLSAASADRLQATLQSYLEASASTSQPSPTRALEESDHGSSERAVDFKTLFKTIQNWVDLSSIDVEQLQSQIQSFNQQVGQVVTTVREVWQPTSTIKDDIENYLLNAPAQHLTRKTIKREFSNAINDSEADPSLIQQQLSQLKQDNFVQILNQRADLSATRVVKLSNQLEDIRLNVLSHVEKTLEDKALKERGDLTENQTTQIIDQAKQAVHSFSKAPQRWAAHTQSMVQNFPTRFDEPLRNIETIRLTLLDQIEQAQQAAQNRVEALKQQAQHQVENARKASAIAAWWLFSIAVTSMVTSAIAGVLAASR